MPRCSKIQTQQRRQQVLTLLTDGHTQQETAAILGVTDQTITDDVKVLSKQWTQETTLLRQKILKELKNRIVGMKDQDLIAFLRVIAPRGSDGEPGVGETIVHKVCLVDDSGKGLVAEPVEGDV